MRLSMRGASTLRSRAGWISSQRPARKSFGSSAAGRALRGALRAPWLRRMLGRKGWEVFVFVFVFAQSYMGSA